MNIFRPADILLPTNCDMEKWSVIACDQFTSQPEYWERLEELVGDEVSTLRLMLPEAYLDSRDQMEEAKRIDAAMDDYLSRGVFAEYENSCVYVERTLKSGAVRRGLIGVLDLEQYDYSKDSISPIRATEGTIEERLPPRVQVRRGASLEMPHIMVFIDDEKNHVFGSIETIKGTLPKLYDFTLNSEGGSIVGRLIDGKNLTSVNTALDSLCDAEMLKAKYGEKAPVVFAMGDGNHSLATAKKIWEETKAGLSPEEYETCPARYSLVELVNIHDNAVTFEPIHKVLFNTNAEDFIAAFEEYWKDDLNDSGAHSVKLCAGREEKRCVISGQTIGQLIDKCEKFCEKYTAQYGGTIDYIHNDDTAANMGRQEGCAAILLPRMKKSELFPSIVNVGAFPKKSFSIGHAEDKRYYLECRKIK